MYNLALFTLRDMTQCGAALRRLGAGASSMEEAASRIVHFLYDSLVSGENSQRACVLVRCFKTHPLGELEPSLQQLAEGTLGEEPASPAMQCLTLIGTAGDLPEWNSRRASAGHQVIPLPSTHAVTRIPMIAQLIQQLGLEVSSVLKPDPSVVVDLQQKSFNVFYGLCQLEAARARYRRIRTMADLSRADYGRNSAAIRQGVSPARG